MKKLTTFFAYVAFVKDKVLEVTGVSDWKEYGTNNILGTKVEVTIVVDNTAYESKDGTQISNVHEKFFLKVPKNIKNNIKIGDVVEAVNPVATIYGKFSENLSVKCDDVKVIKNQSQNAPAKV